MCYNRRVIEDNPSGFVIGLKAAYGLYPLLAQGFLDSFGDGLDLAQRRAAHNDKKFAEITYRAHIQDIYFKCLFLSGDKGNLQSQFLGINQ
jgi:hypothetical protein